MGKIHTVLGLVEPENLGFTLTHDHLLCHPPAFVVESDPDLLVDDCEKSMAELEIFQRAGGGALVEGTAIDYGRDVLGVVDIARSVSVHIVMVTGFNKGKFYPDWVREASVDQLADIMIKDIAVGMDDTGFKAGVIKTGSWYNMVLPEEKKVTIAAAKAHLETGAPIWVHTEVGTMGLEQLDILESEGVNPARVVVGHLDRNPDLQYHLKIARRGAYVGYDGPSKIKYYPDSVRIELIKGFAKESLLDRLMISGDMARRSYLRSYGGGPGLDYIPSKFVPRLLEEGLVKEQVDQVFIENPARWLAF